MGIKMNNLKLRSKIILVYILCALVPLSCAVLCYNNTVPDSEYHCGLF